MWLLLLVFLPPLTWHQAIEIDRYTAWEACQKERDRIGFEMAEAYPWEHDFNIECRYQARVI